MASSRRPVGTNVDCRNDADSAFLGRIGTFGTSGAGRDFTSLGLWETDNDRNMVTDTKSLSIEAFDDAASFDTNCQPAGATTSTTYYPVVRVAAGSIHDGTPNNGVFLDIGNKIAFNVLDQNYHIQDFIVRHTGTTATGYIGCRYNGTDLDGSVYVGMICWDFDNSSTGYPDGFSDQGDAETSGYVNCIDTGLTTHQTNGSFRMGQTAGHTVFVYNCTARGNGHGFMALGGTEIIKNCLGAAEASFDDFFGTWSTKEYVAAQDATGTGTGSRANQTFTFVDVANDDLHLSTSDVGALDFGEDMSADSVYAYNDDIDGDTITTFSMGADSHVAAGGALTPSVSDSLTIAEAVTVLLLNILPSVNDAITVSESVIMNALLMPSVNDAVTVAETVTVLLKVHLKPSVNDSITIAENVNMNIILMPSVNDAITVAESETLLLPFLIPSVSDSVTIVENVTVSIGVVSARTITVSDSVTAAEDIILKIPLNPDVADEITVAETVTMNLLLMPSVDDSMTITESHTVDVVGDRRLIDVFDAIILAETLQMKVGVGGRRPVAPWIRRLRHVKAGRRI